MPRPAVGRPPRSRPRPPRGPTPATPWPTAASRCAPAPPARSWPSPAAATRPPRRRSPGPSRSSSRPPRWARTCSTGGRATTWPATPPATWRPAARLGPDADWTVTVQGNSFRLALGDRVLSVDGAGRLVLTGAAGPGSQFSMEKASGCAPFPEVEIGVTGAPTKGSTAYTETAGFVDAHMHGMAFEFLGGRAHCGKPWSRVRRREGAGRLPRPPGRQRRRRRAGERALVRQPRPAATTPSAGPRSRTGRPPSR